MEQLVLGFFQEHLSKVIVGFRKEQVNANLLNGKGEITDVSLNCAVINEAVRKMSPLLEFEEIHVNRLGFHVTAWANLRKAPILVDIGVITAVVHEPLQCLPKRQRKKLLILTEKELVQLILQGLYKPLRGNGSYGFVDRIVDNLTIEVEAVRLSYQAWGKFKTRRVGPWTPPTLHCEVEHLKVVSVDQYGHESSPDQVWAHNRLGMQDFFMYKKISGEVYVKILDVMTQKSVRLIRRLKFETQTAIKRRLRDGAILGVQVDLTIPSVEMEIESGDIPILAHLLAATQYCVTKDRSFEDPLVPDTPEKQQDITPGTASDMIEEENSDGEEGEEETQEGDYDDDDSVDNSTTDLASVGSIEADETDTTDGIVQTSQPPSSGSSLDAPFKQRPLILLPNGLVIYENVCFTCSVDSLAIRGVYSKGRSGFVQMSSKGFITELIWPKANNQSGLYLQTSVSFVSVQERLDRRVQTILIGGIAHGDHMSIRKVSQKPNEVHADENFPLFERRAIRDDPLDLRHTFPSQAFGAKTTIDDTANDDDDLPPMVLHEVGVDEFDLLLDVDAWCRALRFFLNDDGGGFDPRWHTGDWTDFLTPEMLKDPKGELQLDDHVQNAKQILLDENFMISSDRFNVTARFSNIELRIPAAASENVRSCDILVQIKENTLVVSSALPRTFLSGKIGNSISGDALKSKGKIDFPNDPSDIAYSLEKTEDPSLRLSGFKLSRNVSTFRAQLTVKGFEINTIPIIPFCDAPETRQLIAPMTLTMIACFEGEPPSTGSNFTKIALFVSIHVHKVYVNIDFDLLAGATCSILHQIDEMTKSIAEISESLSTSPKTYGSDCGPIYDDSSGKVKKSLKGKRVMVRKHLDQSRETGGLSVVFCLQVSECGITVWRQNVPHTSPLRHKGDGDDPANGYWDEDHHLRLLKLVDTQLKEFELGVEFDFQAQQGRRTVVKLCLEEGCVLVCNVGKTMGYSDSTSLFTAQDVVDGVNADAHLQAREWNMVELVTFGIEKLPGKLNAHYSGENQQLAIRLEEQLRSGTRSWSLSADFNCPTTVNAYVEEVKDTIILLIEALLLPTWSKREFPSIEGAPFPNHTIGAMFYSVFSPNTAPPKSFDITWDQLPPSNETSSDPFVERALRVIFQLLLPADMQLVLLRVEIANLLLSIPDTFSEKDRRSLGMHLMQTDLTVRFYPNPGTKRSDMEDILASKGVAWSSLIQTKEEGYFQKICSRQSLISISPKEGDIEIEELVHPFNIGLTYAAAKVHLAMDEDLKVNDIRRIESFFKGMKDLQDRSVRYQSELAYFLRAIKQPISDNMESSQHIDDEHAAPMREEGAVPDPRYDINARIIRTQIMLRRTQEKLGMYEKEIRLALQRKNDQLAILQRKVFVCETHRFAALALLSSNVAGWIRSGGVHRTGQRVARKSTFWPYWAVLRKNLLILYASPGEPKPLDVILLEGAKIRQLAGGRSTRDVKRGFAIIERGGITRYFIASTSQEFSRWIQEINEVIHIYRGKQHGSRDEENGNDRSMDDEATSGNVDNDAADLSGHQSDHGRTSQDSEGANMVRARRLGTRFAGAKTRLGAALENARQIGKELSDRNRDASSRLSEPISQLSSREDPTKEFDRTGQGLPSAAETIETYTVGLENAASNSVAENEGSDGASASPKRRLQFGKALTGMKEVTKNKLGAAIQNVRQKGVEASNRRSTPDSQAASGSITANRNSSSSLDAELEKQAGPNSYWTCKVCTFINTMQSSQLSCEMCGAKMPPLSENASVSMISGRDDNVGGGFGPVTTGTSEAVESCTSNGTTSQLEDTRRGRLSAKISAVVRSGLQNSMEDANEENQDARGGGIGMSSRFNFRKLRPGTTSSVSLFDDTAVTLKQVHASGLVPTIGASMTPKVPLKLLEGNWIVSVKPHKSPSMELPTSGLPATQSSCNAKSESSVDVLSLRDNDGPSEIMSQTAVGIPALSSKCLFDIRTHRRDSTVNKSVVQTTHSFGTLVELHAYVSECIGQILPQLSYEHFGKQDREGLDCLVEDDEDSFNWMENVLISGRALGGFFEQDISQQNLEKTREYQAETMEWFLNSLLRCPLPIATLLRISDFLGICASTKHAVTAESECVALPSGMKKTGDTDATREEKILSGCDTTDTKKIDNLSLEIPQEVFGLLSACGTELQRVETSEKLAPPPPEIPLHALYQGSLPIPMNTQVYEPLLPPSVSHQMQLAMHEALVNLMAERDEAHAQLIASNVLHVHELEQERKKNEKLRIEHELKEARRQLELPNVGNFFQNLNDDKSRRILEAKLSSFERILGGNTDEDLADTSRQLADEVTARTSLALEIVRLKETREIERKNEVAEKQALKDELRRVKALLAQQEAGKK